jgi:Ca2+/Na+ antiporter
VLWALGITVFLLLFVIVSQQLWPWTVLPPDNASDTLLLYALSTLNFVAFVVFPIHLRAQPAEVAPRETRAPTRFKNQNATAFLLHRDQLPADHRHGGVLLSVSQPLAGKMVWQFLLARCHRGPGVQREAVDANARKLRDTADLLAAVLKPQSDTEKQATLERVIASKQVSVVQIVDASGRVVAESRDQLVEANLVEVENLIAQARKPGSPGNSLADGKSFDAMVAPISENESLILVSLPHEGSDLEATIKGSQNEYPKLVSRQRRVRSLALSTLGLMTLMLLFVSSWVAIYLARGIATPIKALGRSVKGDCTGKP